MTKASQITIDDLITELDQAPQQASENGNPTAMISATMAKAKLCGLDKGEVTENEAMPVKVVIGVKNARKLTDDDITRNADGSFYIN